MVSTITRSTINSNAFANVLEIINTRTNIADPRDPDNVGSRKFIYDSDPFNTAIDSDGMPYIFVDLPITTYETESANGKVKFLNWKHRIVVRTARRGASKSIIDVGRTDLLNISDDLEETFNKVSIRETLAVANMKMINIDQVSSDVIIVEEDELYEAEFELTYQTRMVTSL